MSMIEVGIAQAYLCDRQARSKHGVGQCTKRIGTGKDARHCLVQTTRSQIPILLGIEAAKPNSNPRRNNEGLIYYYKYPLLHVFRCPTLFKSNSSLIESVAQFILYEFV
ncbi:hypothetical protein HAX54_036010, partial [Datura stramonium]|nr:hypothetical protein [Datura stramonium]